MYMMVGGRRGEGGGGRGEGGGRGRSRKIGEKMEQYYTEYSTALHCTQASHALTWTSIMLRNPMFFVV